MRKNFIPGNFRWRVSTETWDASFFKKSWLEKQQIVPNTCNVLPLKKIFFQNFTDAFFKYVLSILSKLFQKYSLYWYYAVLIFTSKLHDPSPHQQNYPPPPTKTKIPDPPAKTSLKFLNPLKMEGVHAMAFIWYFIRTILSEESC